MHARCARVIVCELRAPGGTFEVTLSGLLTVMIRLIQQVCLVKVYSKKGSQNLLHLGRCDIKPNVIKVWF